MEARATPGSRSTVVLLASVACLAAGLGVRQLLSSPCLRCNGLFAMVLPWAGAGFYLTLSAVAWRRPASAWLSHGLAFAVFAHACLVTERVLLGRFCPGCFAVAGLAGAAALRHAWGTRSDRLTLAAALVLGAGAAWSYPLDRVEASLTRRFWPTRIREEVPSFISRADFFTCGHRLGLQIHLYEDQRSCGTCSSLRQRLLPALAEEFRADLCVHEHLVSNPPAGQMLPMLVVMSRSGTVAAIEGRPDEDELRTLVRSFLARQPSAPLPSEGR